MTGRVRPGVLTRNTRRHHLSGRRWALRTTGRLHLAGGVPAAGGCRGTVRTRFYIGHRIARSLRSPLGGDCRYAASTVIRARRGGSRIRVTTLFRGNAFLRPRSGRLQIVHIG